MEKNILEKLVNDGLSTTEIGRAVNLSQSGIRHWLKKYDLKTKPLHSLENRYKYTDDKILDVWKSSDSLNQFLLNLGVETSGGTWYHYKKRLSSLGVDMSNSIINGRSRGGLKTALLKNRNTIKRRIRLPRKSLKKSMDLENVIYKCSNCDVFEWKGIKLILHIHHKNYDKTDNRIENLEYLCPNCHDIMHNRK